MKKAALLVGLLACTFAAHANDQALNAQKVKVIEKLYAEYYGVNTYKNVNFFSADFNAALKHNDKAAKGELACIDYDYIIQGQDFDGKEIKRTLKIQAQKDGRVKVNFKNFNSPQTIYYVFTCNAKGCLIDDIIEDIGSFKKNLRQCLRKHYPNVKPPK